MTQRPRRKLGVYSLGFMRPQLREALRQTGWDVVPGPFQDQIDAVGIWGARPVSERGKAAAKRRGVPLIHIEDAPLRSVTAHKRAPIMGLTIDDVGNMLDHRHPSRLEQMLNAKTDQARVETGPLLDAYLRMGLSKYNDAWRPATELPERPFVLAVDQLPGDASIRLGSADKSTFQEMLQAACTENPDLPIYVKRHPRALNDPDRTHFSRLPKGVRVLPSGFAVPDVLDKATRVYCVTSQIGFEAILRGHRPRVFGGAYYAGWGLSDDEMVFPNRGAVLSIAALFEAAMVDYPHWFDVYSGQRADLMEAMLGLNARKQAYMRKRRGKVALGLRLWKRPVMREILGDTVFSSDPRQAIARAEQDERQLVAWASSKEADAIPNNVPFLRVEDGFLRSVGLGAELVAPLSICLDDLGIYYDPRSESRLERLINESRHLSADQLARAQALRERLIEAGVSKYNVGSDQAIDAPDRRVILVPGQVEDDASIRLGAGGVARNSELLQIVRSENPDAHILYKPHPDVEAGLRPGAVEDAEEYCDQILCDVTAEAALKGADEVWTMTSLMGFEALLRGIPVVCFGQPFYASWGLTTDRAPQIDRRQRGVSLDGLVHATLIDYPVYRDPLTGLACHPEVVVERLISGQGTGKPVNRLLSKLQGLFAGQSGLWRQ